MAYGTGLQSLTEAMQGELAIDFAPRRARRSDPETSRNAANKAREFAASQAGHIHLALIGCPQNGKELAAATGYTMEQVCRRLPDLQALGLAQVQMRDGKPVTRDNSRVWEACSGA